MPTHVPSFWVGELAYRMRRHLVWKLLGTTAWVWVFFIGYFHLLRHVSYPVTVVPLTPLDALVPTMPLAIVPYLSLWLYVGVAPGLQRTFRELLVYGAWAGVLCISGLAIFYRWPTRIPAFVFDGGGFPGFDLLAGIDSPGNACPSMHVAFAMFTAIWVEVLLRECRVPRALRIANALWFAAITYSTVAIRQHVVLDALAGALLGATLAIPSLMWRPAGRSRTMTRDAPAMIVAGSRDDKSGGDASLATTDDARPTEEMMGIAR